MQLYKPTAYHQNFKGIFRRYVPSLASKREHVTPKHALIGCQGIIGHQTFEV